MVNAVVVASLLATPKLYEGGREACLSATQR